uniref:Candidate secreted effector n=1 Tax=Meloidogyne incognita TaxID=6306 RepID=A0A914L0Y1_MELIC
MNLYFLLLFFCHQNNCCLNDLLQIHPNNHLQPSLLPNFLLQNHYYLNNHHQCYLHQLQILPHLYLLYFQNNHHHYYQKNHYFHYYYYYNFYLMFYFLV